MEHHDWEWSDDDGGHGDAETADLSGGDDLGHSGDFTDFGDHDLGGGHEDLGGHDDLGGQHLSHDNLDEPLGTENAVGAYDADIADHGAGYTHDEDPGHTDTHDADQVSHDADPASHDPDPASHIPDPHDGQPDPADHPFEATDAHGDATGDHLVGVDPDLDHRADDPGWHDDPFPPELHLDGTPEPVDGFPWVDPATLGGHDVDVYIHAVTGDGGADAHDLAQYGGIDIPAGSDPWTALFGAEDPATSSLAQWWAPNG